MENPKNCVISGGTNGVGLATAIRFAKQGGHVAICGRDQGRLEKAKAEIAAFSSPDKVHIFVADLNSSAEARQFVEGAISQMSRVDVFINNASMAPCAPLDEMSDEAIESCINVNVRSVYYATRSIWEHMKSQGAGIIVNLSSTAAVDPFAGFSLYGATKAWIELFTTALANEGREHNIRCYAIRPGAVETAMLRGLFADFPAEQCVSPDDVAAVIEVACGQGMVYSSGQTIKVSLQ
ncbi:MAG: SDR family NAD(P)-dependent oxidoreductase [Pirellulaceae bacterium]|nr:SDR family NAD(P)-dependent oxidoreductase [Pirellulaceae bacterium]